MQSGSLVCECVGGKERGGRKEIGRIEEGEGEGDNKRAGDYPNSSETCFSVLLMHGYTTPLAYHKGLFFTV